MEGRSCQRMTTAKQIWNGFCDAQRIAVDSVPLFSSDRDGFVETKEIGQKAKRKVLVRHREMEELIVKQTDILVEDWSGRHMNCSS
jgi:hypothetical protein